MADTKISALTGVGSSADANEFAVNEAGTSKKASLTQIETQIMLTPTITSPIIAAGSSSANSKMKLTSGTVLTTPEAGALEYDGTCFYGDPVASQRGVIGLWHLACLSSTYTLANSGSAQKLFNVPSNGALTLPTGTYFFDCLFSISVMSATSGNAAFGILGAGSATIGSILYHCVGIDGATATAATQTGSTSVATTSAASIVSAGTNTNMQANITGTFRVTGTGTIIPSITLVTGVATAVVAVGSYFKCMCVGSSSVTTVGNWA